MGFPFHIPSAGTACPGVRRAKRRARRFVARDRSVPIKCLAALLDAASLLCWPVWLAGQMRRGLALRRQRGGGGRRPSPLFVYWYCLRHQLTPAEYFLYRLDEPGHPYDVDDYLFSFESPRLFSSLNSVECRGLCGDKLALYRLLASVDLQVPRTCVVKARGRSAQNETGVETLFRPLGDRIWVKPRKGSAGRGSQAWELRQGLYRGSEGRSLTAIELLQSLYAKAASEQQDQLVQERLSNHPVLEELSNGALCVLRAVTIGTPDAPPLLALAYLDLPCGTAGKSNQGIVVNVDTHSGRLSGARLHRDMDVAVTTHPDTGKTIEGCTLPDWDRCRATLREAHRNIPGAGCLAWDLGFTTLGPVLLEANASFVVDEFQRLQQRPVGRTRLGSALNEQIEALDSQERL